MVYIFLGDGFEEIEALTACDVLRRAGAEVSLAGVGKTDITGAHGIRVTADCTDADVDIDAAEMLVVPGVLGGVEAMEASENVLSLLRRAFAADKEIAAICAGPRVLTKAGVLSGVHAVCYPGMEYEMSGIMSQEKAVVRDGKITTGRGVGCAMEFAFALAETVCGADAARAVAEETYFTV